MPRDDFRLHGRPVPTVYFLRHGQTTWNAEKRIQGQYETDLSDLGRKQAQRQQEILKPILATQPELWVSPLRRTRQTAEIVFSDAPYRTDARLMEAHVGDWQGRLWEEVKAEDPRCSDPNLPVLEMYLSAPNAEDISAFRSRILSFVKDLKRPSVVVSHALVSQVLRGLILGLTWRDAVRLPYEQACVYVLEDGREHVLR